MTPCGEEIRTSRKCAALERLERRLSRNFGRPRGTAARARCFSRARCPILPLVSGKYIVTCGHLLRSCSTAPGVRCQARSSRFAVVVPQDAAESLAALDLTGDAAHLLVRSDQSVVEALVIALCVIMGQERNRSGFCPKNIRRWRHSSFRERMKRSMWGLQL